MPRIMPTASAELSLMVTLGMVTLGLVTLVRLGFNSPLAQSILCPMPDTALQQKFDMLTTFFNSSFRQKQGKVAEQQLSLPKGLPPS